MIKQDCGQPVDEALLKWVISDQSGRPLEPTQLMKTLMKVANDADTGGVCLILPVAAGVDQLAAILTAIARMRGDCDAVVLSHENRTFLDGQHVKCLPDGFVYEVAGAANENTGDYPIEGYWLQQLDSRKGQDGGRFLIKKSDFKRFEATKRKRPIGRGKQTWSPLHETPLDKLAETKTFGNLSLQRNRVIVIGTKTETEESLGSFKLQLADLVNEPAWPDLSRWVAWGGLDEDGKAYVESSGNAVGEPLIAATRDFQIVRKASEQAAQGSLHFITRSIDACLRNIETVSRLAERQRFVLVAAGRDREKITPFQKEGWLVWELSPTEILGVQGDTLPELSALSSNISAAIAESTLSLAYYQASNIRLAGCKVALDTLAGCVERAEVDENLDDRVENLIAEVWETFLLFCSWLTYPTQVEVEAESQRITQMEFAISLLRPAMADEIWEHARLAVEALKAFLEMSKVSTDTEKGLALLDAIANEKPDRLIVGRQKDVTLLQTWAKELLTNVRIEVAGAGEVIPTETAVALSLIGRRAFDKLVDPVPTARLSLVGYDFECDTYQARLRWRKKRRLALRPEQKFRERIIGGNADLDEGKLEPTVESPETHHPTERFEHSTRPPKIQAPEPQGPSDESREGRLCIFEGCSWAVFTLGHGLSVASDSLGNKIVKRTVNDLMVGDRLIIREGGQKDVIRLLAEHKAGIAHYDQLWKASRKWRDAISKISDNPQDLWQKLSWAGLHRDRMTVRGWLLDDSTIGPKNREDLTIIAELADDNPDSQAWTECWRAIQKLRGLHMNAGTKLGRLLDDECQGLLDEAIDKETPIELTFGLVWLVQVREIHQIADWSYNAVNHLKWGNDAWQSRMKSTLKDARI